jgi:hypothetical protein
MTPKTYPATVVPCLEAPSDVRPIVEAPPDVTELFTRWSAAGFPWQSAHELAGALQPYRGVRLLTPLYVVWLTKSSDRDDDEVCVAPRSWPVKWRMEVRP